MSIKIIKNLTERWNSATWDVIEFQNPEYEEVRVLFQETYEIIEEYSKENLVPKELSHLLLEMHDFGWWVSDLHDTPLHCYYQEIVSVVSDLNKYFLTRNVDVDDIMYNIEKIGE